MNWPWLRNPALASSIDIPAGSMVFTRANWFAFLEIFAEIAFGSNEAVVGEATGLELLDTAVEVDSVADTGSVVPPRPVPPAFAVASDDVALLPPRCGVDAPRPV